MPRHRGDVARFVVSSAMAEKEEEPISCRLKCLLYPKMPAYGDDTKLIERLVVKTGGGNHGNALYKLIAIDVFALEPCADVILSAAAFRVILTGGGGGAPIDFFSAAAASLKCRRRRRSSA